MLEGTLFRKKFYEYMSVRIQRKDIFSMDMSSRKYIETSEI